MRLLELTFGILTAKMAAGAIINPPSYEGIYCTGDGGYVGFCMDSRKPTTQTLCTAANGFAAQADSLGSCNVHPSIPPFLCLQCQLISRFIRAINVAFLRVERSFPRAWRRRGFALIPTMKGK